MAARTGAAFPGGPAGGRLQVVAADLAVAGFGVDVVDRWGDGQPGGLPAVTAGQRAAERRALLVILRAELARLGVRAWPQPGGQSLGIWPGLFAGVSQDAARYGWTTGTTAVCTHPAGDAGGAARRIARHDDVLAGGGGLA